MPARRSLSVRHAVPAAGHRRCPAGPDRHQDVGSRVIYERYGASAMSRTDTAVRVISASPHRVSAAPTDPKAVALRDPLMPKIATWTSWSTSSRRESQWKRSCD